MNQTDPIADLRQQNAELQTQIQNLLTQVGHLNKMLSGTEPQPKQLDLGIECDRCSGNDKEKERKQTLLETNRKIRETILEALDAVDGDSEAHDYSLRSLMLRYSDLAGLKFSDEEEEDFIAAGFLEEAVSKFFSLCSLVECSTSEDARRLARSMRAASNPAGIISIAGRTFVYKL